MIIRFLITILILQLSAFGQTLVARYGDVNTSVDAANIDKLVSAIRENQGTRGLILINSGKDAELLGNVLGYKSRVETYVRSRISDVNDTDLLIRVEIVSDGKRFQRDLWLMEKDDPDPDFRPFIFDLSTLDRRTLYASNECKECAPGELDIWQFDWDKIIEVLKENPNVAAEFEIGKNAIYSSWDEERKTAQMTPDRYLQVLKSWFEGEADIEPAQIKFRLVDGPNERIFLSRIQK
ncbi:MAG: hypothetical protein KDB79_07330 [Acidobacteria bacterium]|nr:hypothetical protein [Acidobacteriota bacterium]